MENPWKLQNTNGSPNAGGGLKYFSELEVVTRETPHLLRFYIADMGPDDLVLGYPWFAATNAHPVLRYRAWTAAMFFSFFSCFTISSPRRLPSPRMTPVDDM